MNQPNPNPTQPAHKPKRSGVCLFIEITILLTVLLASCIGLVYYFGNEQLHSDIPHALNQIFNTETHQNLVTNLNKKAYQHAVVWGENSTGIFQFLEHYADMRAGKGGLVIVKRVENNIYETALKFIRYTKQYIEDNINIENNTNLVEWVYLVRDHEDLPLEDIQKIKNSRKKDRIVVGCNKKIQIKGFKAVEFPAVQLAVVEKVIAQDFDITAKQASILVNYYGTVPEILKHLDQISYTHQKHLGPNYQNLKDLSKNQLKTLKVLCTKGVAPLEGNVAALEQIGAVSFQGKVYWQQRVKRLNYELSQQVQCVDKIVPEAIKIKIAQKRQQQSKAQIEGDDQQSAKPVTGKSQKKQAKAAVKQVAQQKVAKSGKGVEKQLAKQKKGAEKNKQKKVEKAAQTTKSQSQSKSQGEVKVKAAAKETAKQKPVKSSAKKSK